VMGSAKSPEQSSSLTLAERQKILRIVGLYNNRGAKILGVGQETYLSLIDPHGRVTKKTIDKVRLKLEKLDEEDLQV
jgi:hypothetical protein